MDLLLRRIAGRIADDQVAAQRDLSVSLRECLHPKILALFPNEYFEDKLYDTSDMGKGTRAGYVSFGLKPAIFDSKGLIGGILIRGEYDASTIKSGAPEAGTDAHKEWVKGGGNPELEGNPTEIVSLEACYYNKRVGGGAKREAPEGKDPVIAERGIYTNTCCAAGKALFTVNELEEVIDCDIENPDQVKSCIEGIVNGILKNPPEGSEKAPRRRVDQYGSVRRFVNYLQEEGRDTYTADEVRMIAQRTDSVPTAVEGNLKRIRGLGRDPNSVFGW